MSYFEYVSDARVLAELDEKYLGTLVNRQNSKTWDKKTLQAAKKNAAALFESYAINKYDLVELRVDPPPEFAVTINMALILRGLYKSNKRHYVPKAIEKDYDRYMEMMAEWGDPQIIDEDGGAVTGADVLISGNKTEEDFEFQYEDQQGMW